jgi:hypothetical protein
MLGAGLDGSCPVALARADIRACEQFAQRQNTGERGTDVPRSLISLPSRPRGRGAARSRRWRISFSRFFLVIIRWRCAATGSRPIDPHSTSASDATLSRSLIDYRDGRSNQRTRFLVAGKQAPAVRRQRQTEARGTRWAWSLSRRATHDNSPRKPQASEGTPYSDSKGISTRLC